MIFCGICQELNKVDFGQRESNCKDSEKSKGQKTKTKQKENDQKAWWDDDN